MSDTVSPFDDEELERAHAELSRRFQALGVDYASLSVDDKGALLPFEGAEVAADTVDESTLPGVGYDLGISKEKLLLGEVLGEGGEGIVRLAVQPSLARTVAVKVLPPVKEKGPRAAALLREARITGALEHPNIVPVHDIGLDDGGVPMIVMKRIEGRAWIHELRRARPPALEDEWLEKQMRVLVQVARAVSFAHARRVLHRDLKPANVMIGPFDEVYVVDWGAAAALPGCEIEGLPPARVTTNVVGTPSYMAPEMVMAGGGALTEQSDVYLLGAILHEIVTGWPPHYSPSLALMVAKAFRAARPAYDDTVPKDLVALLERALAKDPADRFESAAAMADALEDFLRHRHSMALCAAGEQKAAALDAALAGDGEEPAGLWRECRSLFEQSLLLWRDNPDAQRGLGQAATRMVQHELAADRPDAARAVLGSLAAPPAELAALVEEAEASTRDRAATLERIARDADLKVGIGGRSIGGAALGAMHVTVHLACAAADRTGALPIGNFEYAVVQAGVALLALGVLFLLRKRVLRNEVSRRMSVVTNINIAFYAPFFALCGWLGVPFVVALALRSFLRAAVWATTAYALDRVLFLVAVVTLAEMALILSWPHLALEIIAMTGLASMLAPPVAWSLLQRRSQER